MLIAIGHYFSNYLTDFFIFICEFDPSFSKYSKNRNLTEIHLSKVSKITM